MALRAITQVMGPPSDDGNSTSFTQYISVSTNQFGAFDLSCTLLYADTPTQMNTKMLNAIKQALLDRNSYTVTGTDTLVTFNKAA